MWLEFGGKVVNMGKRVLHRLSELQIKTFKERGYYADGGGLYFRISEYETRGWVFRYSRQGKAREMGLGTYPDVTLKEARNAALECRKALLIHQDPIEKRKALVSTMLAERQAGLTFEQCANEFIKAKEHEWKNTKSAGQWRATLETYAFPVIGKMLVRDVEQTHILKILEPIWTNKTETASRLRGRIESIIDYARARKYRTTDNPAAWKGHLDKILAAPSKVKTIEHHPALPFKRMGAFMEALGKQAGNGARALEFTILTNSRTGETRKATWKQIDLENAVWTIPPVNMKAGKEHRVPLSPQALKLLSELPRTGDYVFPGATGEMLSDMSVNAVIRRMNNPEMMWTDEQGRGVVAHGFRSSFRDWAGETTAYPREVIEHSMAHKLKDKAEAAYARGTMFDKRRGLMDAWAKYCYTQGNMATVTPINRGKIQ